MTKQEFQTLTEKKILVLDGAMGTNLFLRGLPRGANPEQWTLQHPDVVIGLQKEYVEAGSDIIYAPTFGANRARLADAGIGDKVREMNLALVGIARKAAGEKALIAGDMSPTGFMLESIGGEASEEEVFDVYTEQAKALQEAGVDLMVIETMMSADELLIALDAVQSVTDIPVMCTMSVDPQGRAIFGGLVYDAVKAAEEKGAAAVGINCSSGPDHMVNVIEKIAQNVSIPVIAKPNAGIPVIDKHGIAKYDMNAELFTEHMKTLISAGASIIGGCCGTTPEYIRSIKELAVK